MYNLLYQFKVNRFKRSRYRIVDCSHMFFSELESIANPTEHTECFISQTVRCQDQEMETDQCSEGQCHSSGLHILLWRPGCYAGRTGHFVLQFRSFFLSLFRHVGLTIVISKVGRLIVTQLCHMFDGGPDL